ncbi:AAA family ATPase [Clostridium sp.]|uniref:AAA family ATPase n=1 Tax=Clostridium sp. TaxID=1506 RepID=UPI00338D5C8A
MSNCKTISVCNQKGGVGKPPQQLISGVGLCNAGQRKVLLIDADPQGRFNKLILVGRIRRRLGYHACNETHRCNQ